MAKFNHDRFIQSIDYLLVNSPHLTKKEIAKNLNISASKFSQILNKAMNPGIDLYEKICNDYGFSAEWLLLGRGEMLNKIESGSIAEEPRASYIPKKEEKPEEKPIPTISVVPYEEIKAQLDRIEAKLKP